VDQAARTRHGQAVAAVLGVLCITALAIAAFVGGWLTSPAGATGILPPNNPPGDIAPSSTDFLASIDSARAAEGVGPMNVSEATISGLPIPEQAFIVVNEERLDRGLPPISDMTAQLDADAQEGADAGDDPSFPASMNGGAQLTWGGSVWAGGLSSVFEADYYWMYADGFAGSQAATTNEDCTSSSSSGCWGHRDIILHQFNSCGSAPVTLSMGAAFSSTGASGGSIAVQLIGSCGPAPAGITMTWSQVEAAIFAAPRIIGIATLQDGKGYWEAEANGAVAAFGAAANYGSMATATLNSPVVGIAATPDGQGYWLVAADGGVFSFGDAPFRGSMGGHTLNRPVVGMATDPATDGYWLVAADGGIFSFDAPYFGSTGDLRLDQPIVGMEALAGGQGYRFEAADGGVFCFGAASFSGSMSGDALAAPVVGMAADPVTNGYWLVAADGGVFSFGNAAYYGRITG